jgi:hypothetical protein
MGSTLLLGCIHAAGRMEVKAILPIVDCQLPIDKPAGPAVPALGSRGRLARTVRLVNDNCHLAVSLKTQVSALVPGGRDARAPGGDPF